MNITRSLIIFCSFVPLGCYAASFDCNKAVGPIEEAICEDQQLADLDEILNRTYKVVMKISPNTSALKAEQRRWLTKIRNRCKKPDCLTVAYETRIAELEKTWEKQTNAINAAVVRDDFSMAKPFEGDWKSCQLFKGEEICSSYLLIQNGKRVCGEWEYWATYRTYAGRLQAKTQGQEVAVVELICGRPGSETNTECEYQKNHEDRWEKTQGTLSVCGTHLYAGSAKQCSVLRRSPGMAYQPMTSKQREELLSQSWVKRCLSDG